MKTAVLAVIERNGKILLSREKGQSHYKCVGGGVNPGESLESALYREFSEEALGARIISHRYWGADRTRRIETTLGGKTLVKVELHYFDVVIEGEPQPNPKSDVEELKWFDSKFARDHWFYLTQEIFKNYAQTTGAGE